MEARTATVSLVWIKDLDMADRVRIWRANPVPLTETEKIACWWERQRVVRKQSWQRPKVRVFCEEPDIVT